MARKPTQCERVLQELRRAGRRGITSHEIRTGMGDLIANPGARIEDLERRGHIIHHEREPVPGNHNLVRYRLALDAEGGGTAAEPRRPVSPATDTSSVEPEQRDDESEAEPTLTEEGDAGQLFDLPPRGAHYGDEEAA
jgi:Helix-turn-helix domain